MNNIKTQIMAHIDTAAPGQVWVPTDFIHLGSRSALSRPVSSDASTAACTTAPR